MHELATTVYQIRGHIKGKTLLPFPQVCKENGKVEKKRPFLWMMVIERDCQLNLAAQEAVYIEDEERKVNT